jgi:hypothetical protein
VTSVDPNPKHTNCENTETLAKNTLLDSYTATGECVSQKPDISLLSDTVDYLIMHNVRTMHYEIFLYAL